MGLLFSKDAAGQEDSAGAGSPDFDPSVKGIQDTPFEMKDSNQPGEARALPSRKNQSRNPFKIKGFFDSFTGYAQAFQMIQMLANPTLKVKNANSMIRTTFAANHRL